jgi:hypothetical protein
MKTGIGSICACCTPLWTALLYPSLGDNIDRYYIWWFGVHIVDFGVDLQVSDRRNDCRLDNNTFNRVSKPILVMVLWPDISRSVDAQSLVCCRNAKISGHNIDPATLEAGFLNLDLCPSHESVYTG